MSNLGIAVGDIPILLEVLVIVGVPAIVGALMMMMGILED